ncbi:DUF397 domain-containing protein [Nocardia cyriacigeorgica]|uniref:DUF397 domain-containing protein n=1 Tax=Nocardia cyriacigeorgica TaxID=135487 RepID=UPI001892EB66|nr:DUF397 domain-containing protein [Nocardia cyriacigeorgica]MBF6397895.1 DUF397 domain-containing protein [Nocardia cyriacigeorgica]MBF6402448.1 DUF397 domain-containing protein [Nocardia cyriacigeorgica]
MTTPVRGTNWRKSSYSNNGGASCVEVRFAGTEVLVRDSKYLRNPANDPDQQPVIAIPRHLWTAFLDLAAGHRSANHPALPTLKVHLDGSATIHAANGTKLAYTPAEWAAFTAGIHNGEFAAA